VRLRAAARVLIHEVVALLGSLGYPPRPLGDITQRSPDMNDSTYKPTLCVGADVHLDEIVLRAVDKALGHEVLQRFRVTNNLPGAQRAATTIAQTAMDLGYARIEIGWESTGMLTY
jgi:hypothetical protein